MEQRLSLVTLGVADLERSRRSYEDGLGWRRSTQDPGITFYQVNGSVLGLFPRDALAADAGLPNDRSGFWRLQNDQRGQTIAAEEASAPLVRPVY